MSKSWSNLDQACRLADIFIQRAMHPVPVTVRFEDLLLAKQEINNAIAAAEHILDAEDGKCCQ